MGVHGLTTYLREHKSALARTVQHHIPTPSHPDSPGQKPERALTPLVIDGWSFIYQLICSADIPWVYGGEYDKFTALITRVVRAWVHVGLALYFVFDGPYPALKFPTIAARVTQTTIQRGLLFFRTSPAARAAPRFLHETAMLPPHSYVVCVAVLRALAASDEFRGALEVHFADEEGDPYAVALAGRLRACVAGCDSDFAVFNADGYRGYVPLDEMVWSAASAAEDDAEGSVYSGSADTEFDVDDSGFRTVRPKARRRAAVASRLCRGLLPPDDAAPTDLALSYTVYTPDALAAHLALPVSLLPLLGALVGNDFTGGPPDSGRRTLQHLFFERRLAPAERIARVALTLRGILADAFAAPAQKKRARRQVGSVMELIDVAVGALLLRTTDADERAAVVERIVEATLQYAIPRGAEGESEEGEGARGTWASDVCVLHTRDACPLFQCLSPPGATDGASASSHDAEGDVRAHVSELYIAAYRRGELNPRVLDPVSTGTGWPWLFLEDPDKECVARSVGRPLREWLYAVLHAGVGLRAQVGADDEGGEAGDQDAEGDEDELVDVVEDEDDEDPLAPLRGALQKLDGSVDGDGSDSVSAAAPPLAPLPSAGRPTIVVERVRRGTRLAEEEVLVHALPDVLAALSVEPPPSAPTLPPQLWPEELRMLFLLRAVGADEPPVRALRGERLAAVLAVRWAVRCMHVRAEASGGSKAREQERWTQGEARAFLGAFAWPPRSEEEEEERPAVALVGRSVQLVAQVCAALEAVEQLAQAVLVPLGTPMRFFSGWRFHGALAAGRDGEREVESEMWEACVAGLEDAYAVVVAKKSRKERKGASGGSTPAKTQGPPKSAVGKGGLYSVLADMSA